MTENLFDELLELWLAGHISPEEEARLSAMAKSDSKLWEKLESAKQFRVHLESQLTFPWKTGGKDSVFADRVVAELYEHDVVSNPMAPSPILIARFLPFMAMAATILLFAWFAILSLVQPEIRNKNHFASKDLWNPLRANPAFQARGDAGRSGFFSGVDFPGVGNEGLNLIYACCADNKIRILDAKDGSLLFAKNVQTRTLEPVLDSRGRLILRYPNFLYALDGSNGDALWRQKAEGSRFMPCVWGDRIYLADDNGNCNVFAALDGQGCSGSAFEKGLVFSPIASEAGIILPLQEKKIRVKNPDDDRLVWEFELKAELEGSPCIAGNILYAADKAGSIYGWDLEKGLNIFIWDLGVKITSTISISGGFLLASCEGRGIRVIDLATGSIHLEISSAQTLRFISCKGDLLIYSEIAPEGKIVAMKLAERETIWEKAIDKDFLTRQPLIGKDCVVLSSTKGDLTALSLKDASILWRKDLKTSIFLPLVAAGK